MRPWSNTRIRSAPRMVDSRWAITTVVRPTISSSMAAWTWRSVSTSRDEVASSSTRIGASARKARAMAAGQLHAAFAHQSVVAPGQGRDEVVGAGPLGGQDHLVLRRLGPRVADV